MVGGIAFGGSGVTRVEELLSPWPAPVEGDDDDDDDDLKTDGVHGLVRHPTYTGKGKRRCDEGMRAAIGGVS